MKREKCCFMIYEIINLINDNYVSMIDINVSVYDRLNNGHHLMYWY
jgi:hypothetical protein